MVGWDIGGAHLKAAFSRHGKVADLLLLPCPLWRGLAHLEQAVDGVLGRFREPAIHAVTMTGEMVDLFASRRDGVQALVELIAERLKTATVLVYGGRAGFLPAHIAKHEPDHVASANWLASVEYLSGRLANALFVDMGSTTTDVVVIARGRVEARGHSDYERLRFEELSYTGAARTPIAALADQVPFAGEWRPLMAEHFATTADVHRLTGDLPPIADLHATLDGEAKTPEASARRLARTIGADMESASLAAWRELARHLAEVQLQRVRRACERQLSRGLLPGDAPIVGGGVGRFMVERLARRLDRPYVDLASLIDADAATAAKVADSLPAAAVALLAARAVAAGTRRVAG